MARSLLPSLQLAVLVFWNFFCEAQKIYRIKQLRQFPGNPDQQSAMNAYLFTDFWLSSRLSQALTLVLRAIAKPPYTRSDICSDVVRDLARLLDYDEPALMYEPITITIWRFKTFYDRASRVDARQPVPYLWRELTNVTQVTATLSPTHTSCGMTLPPAIRKNPATMTEGILTPTKPDMAVYLMTKNAVFSLLTESHFSMIP